jgi:hypothetical protein
MREIPFSRLTRDRKVISELEKNMFWRIHQFAQVNFATHEKKQRKFLQKKKYFLHNFFVAKAFITQVNAQTSQWYTTSLL